MKRYTKEQKAAARQVANLGSGAGEQAQVLEQLLLGGQAAVNEAINKLGVMFLEGLLFLERDSLAGPDYNPSSSDIVKGGTQRGSVCLGGSKVPINKPRLRSRKTGEIALKSYESMHSKSNLSETIMRLCLRGVSTRDYESTVRQGAAEFGISGASVSRSLVEATAAQLDEFLNRTLNDFKPFCIYLDAIIRDRVPFIVALGINMLGEKKILGFWEGVTESAEVCGSFLSNLISRGLVLSENVIFITDGGKGMIKALKKHIGPQLLLQRCLVHKLKNLIDHLPKKHHFECKMRFNKARSCSQYQDAKAEFLDLEKWLRRINESASNSLLEAFDELLTIQRIRTPEELRKTLQTTNPIESVFSITRKYERNIKRYKNPSMRQRWLAAAALEAEKRLNRICGYAMIQECRRRIESYQALQTVPKAA